MGSEVCRASGQGVQTQFMSKEPFGELSSEMKRLSIATWGEWRLPWGFMTWVTMYCNVARVWRRSLALTPRPQLYGSTNPCHHRKCKAVAESPAQHLESLPLPQR